MLLNTDQKVSIHAAVLSSAISNHMLLSAVNTDAAFARMISDDFLDNVHTVASTYIRKIEQGTSISIDHPNDTNGH